MEWSWNRGRGSRRLSRRGGRRGSKPESGTKNSRLQLDYFSFNFKCRGGTRRLPDRNAKRREAMILNHFIARDLHATIMTDPSVTRIVDEMDR